jgi:hypothetical protein
MKNYKETPEEKTIIYEDGAVFHNVLQCFVVNVMYDYRIKVCVILMEEYSCTDMRGAILTAENIDKNVKCIKTLQINKNTLRADTLYRKDESGSWKAFCVPPQNQKEYVNNLLETMPVLFEYGLHYETADDY